MNKRDTLSVPADVRSPVPGTKKMLPVDERQV